MDKATALRKIKKCMALAKSCEPAEAEAAMRQATKLMTEFEIDSNTLAASEVSEEWVKSRASKTPPRYEVWLASLVASAFACDIVFCREINKQKTAIHGGYAFIGVTPAPVLASYAFAVLQNKMQKARKQYADEKLRRYKKNKVVAADIFCEGWVESAVRNIAAVKPSESRERAIAAFVRVNHPHLRGGLKPLNRGEKVSNVGQHYGEGRSAGRNGDVQNGLGHADKLRLESA